MIEILNYCKLSLEKLSKSQQEKYRHIVFDLSNTDEIQHLFKMQITNEIKIYGLVNN